MGMYGMLVEDSRITSGKGRAKQSMKDECDVNLIVAQFTKTGFMSHVATGLPSFVDVSELTDYRSAIEHVRSVEEWFSGLPAEVRARFRNDAVEFMEYLDGGATEDEFEELGRQVLGDRRSRGRDEREGDSRPPDVVPPPAVDPPAADGTLPT